MDWISVTTTIFKSEKKNTNLVVRKKEIWQSKREIKGRRTSTVPGLSNIKRISFFVQKYTKNIECNIIIYNCN